VKIARQLTGGIGTRKKSASVVGTTEMSLRRLAIQPSLAGLARPAGSIPGAEAPGYFQVSLRDWIIGVIPKISIELNQF